MWPNEPWQQMTVVVWGVLIVAAIPLAVLIPFRKRAGKPVKSMWIKYGAWFIIAPLVTIPLALGRYWMQSVFLLMSLYAFEEFSRAVGLWRSRGHIWLARLCIALLYLPVFLDYHGLFVAAPAYAILLIFLFPVVGDKFKGMIQLTCLTIMGVVYFGWFLGHMAFLANREVGRQLILAFLLIVAVNDAAAYVIGSTLGRRKLSPNISPNKTVEGMIGAMLVAIGMTFAVRFALLGIAWPHALLLGFLLGLGGTCGDLVISMIKRDVQIKDTGSLIPGHGGLLDRLDSVLFTAPIFFHFMNYFCEIV